MTDSLSQVSQQANAAPKSHWTRTRHRLDPVPAILLLVFLLIPMLSHDSTTQNILTLSMIWAFWSMSLNVIWGYAGQFSMAQVALGGLTAYVFVVLVSKEGWGVLPAIAIGMVGTVVFSVLIGLMCLRLEGFRFAIMTLAFALAGIGLASSLELTGRTSGISVTGDWVIVHVGPVDWGLSSLAGGFTIFMFLVFLLLSLGLWLLLRTREGRGLLAIREDSLLAESLGVSSRRYRLLAFALSAVVASFAGVFQAEYYKFIYPSLFSFETLVTAIVVLVLGGRGHLFGPLVGGVLYSALTTGLHLGGRYQTGVFGALVILITVFARHGLTYYLGAGERLAFGAAVSRTARREAAAKFRDTLGRLRSPTLRGAHTQEAQTSSADQLLADAIAQQGIQEPAAAEPVARAPKPELGDVLLEVRGLSKSFGGVAASRDLSFEVRQGEILGLIGPNGAGKTTAFNLVSGFMRPDSGSIRWRGQDITRVPAFRRSRRGLVRTFQQPRTFPALSVRENLVIAAQSTTSAVTGRAARIPVEQVIEMFELGNVADGPAADLSYGFAKRLGVAMAVATNPQLVMLDEPAAGLNSQDIRSLCDDLLALRASGGSICIVEHHMDLVMEICDRVIVLDAGSVIAAGSPDEVMRDPQVIEAYLGTSS